MKGFIVCVGCEQRELDAQRVRDYFSSNGFTLTDRPEDCEYAIVITCAVDESKTKASVRAIETTAARMSASAKLIVGGCLPSISPEQLLPFPVHITFSPRNLVDRLQPIFDPQAKIPLSSIAKPNKSIWDLAETPRPMRPGKARAEYDAAKKGFKIAIAQGCREGCSYCVIRKAFGKLCSEPPELIMTQIRKAIADGEPTIMLMGGDVGAYGQDIGFSLPALLLQILLEAGEFQLFLHDFGIHWLVKDSVSYRPVFQLNRQVKKLHSLCLPIQSGSDAILVAMRRRYRVAEIIRVIEWIRDINPGIHIGTHIIAGFPGETAEDFDQTLALLERIQFDFLTCFSYSEHPQSSSAALSPKIAVDIVHHRLNILLSTFGNIVTIVR